jgi:hypothetical protein
MMNRILKRPMFRMGGRSDDGIMSVRPGFQEGGSLFQKGMFKAGQAYTNLKNKIPFRGITSNLFGSAGRPTVGTIGPTTQAAGAGTATALMTAPFVLPAGIAAANYPVYPKGHPKEGEFMPLGEAKMVLEESGEAGTAADIAGEAAMFDLDLPESSGGKMDIYGNKKYATKLDFESPQVIENSIDLGIISGDTTDDDTTDDDDTTNKGSKFDKKADLKTIYEDLLPMMKETLDDPDDKRRQLYTQLAQFGANLLAQPGGDLVGAVGKAAIKPIEGVGKVLQRDSDVDREAKILALKTAIDRTTPGATGKLVQDLRALDFSDDEIMKYLEAQKPGAGQRAVVKAGDIDTLKDDLTNDFKIKKNAGVAARTMYLSIQEGVDETQYSELPSNKNDREDEKYYVSPNGEVGRYDAKTGTLIKPGEKGFTGKKKKKS